MEPVNIVTELYGPLLKALNITYDESGQLFLQYPDKQVAQSVNKLNLLMPLPSVLHGVPENALVFHPMSENVARGDSAIQNYLKTVVTFKLSFSIAYIAQKLYQIASDKSLHDKLTGDQLTILSILPDADKKGENNLGRILDAIDMKHVRVVNVFNKRSGKFGSSVFNRVSVITFPLLMEMLKPEGTAWAHRDVRKRDSKDFKALFDYILPDWDVEDTYSAASDSMEAPGFHALATSFTKVMEPLNRITKIYGSLFVDKDEESGEIISMADYVSADLDFVPRLSNLSKYRNIVPVMIGNDGEALAGTQKEEVVQNPRSIAPGMAATLEATNNTANVPQVQSQQPQPVVQQGYQTPPQQQPMVQMPMNSQPAPGYVQQQQNQAQPPAPGVAGFGTYDSRTAQARPMLNPYTTPANYQQQGYQTGVSGVAGFGNYPTNGNGFQQPMMNQGYVQPQQQQQPTVFDQWNRTAAQMNQQNQMMTAQVNPYTQPTSPQQQMMNQYGGQQNNQMLPPGHQVVVGQNGQQLLVNQMGQVVQVLSQPMQQMGWNNQMQNQGMYQQNPYVQQQQVGFKVTR